MQPMRRLLLPRPRRHTEDTLKTHSGKKGSPNRFPNPCDKGLKEQTEDLFASAAKGAGINLHGTSTTSANKKGKRNAMTTNYLMITIFQVVSLLVTLFLKPKSSYVFPPYP